jgi:DNA (cytosine-5)-methyltransferase 1
MKKPTLAALFAGCGGDSLGFVDADFELIYANDNNGDACKTLRKKFENSSGKKIVHDGNVEKIKDFDHASVIIGGFPCQGFSLAGPRKVGDKRNTLYRELKRAIDSTSPEFFVAENVKGFVTIGEKSKAKYFHNGKIENLGKVADVIIKELSEIGKGYVVHRELLNAKDFGLPQNRERIIIVGIRKDLDFAFKFPKSTHGKGKIPYVTMEKYGVKKIKFDKKEVFMETKGKRKDFFSSRYMSRNRIRRWDQVSFTIPAEARQVPAHPSSKRMWNRDVMGKNRPKDDEWIEFRKKHEKDISKDLIRMSWRQCAAIQGFPNDYPFCGNTVSIYKQIGNAVPPLLMQKVAECIIPFYKGKKLSY